MKWLLSVLAFLASIFRLGQRTEREKNLEDAVERAHERGKVDAAIDALPDGVANKRLFRPWKFK